MQTETTITDMRTLSALQRWRNSPAGIFLACFLFALQDSASMLALPWRIIHLGGSSIAVGALGALALGTYMVCCLWTGSRMESFSAKRLAVISTFTTAVILICMPCVNNVGLLLTLLTFKGMVMSMYWPPIMGWVSTGMQGQILNRRLSFFNFSWSFGCIFGSWMGGMLFAVSQSLPFRVAAVASALACIFLSLVIQRPSSHEKLPLTVCDSAETVQLRVFRWITRVWFVSGWIALGALRVPIANLIRDMSSGSQVHAAVTAGQNIILVICFYLLGRWAFWHFRFSAIAVSQIILTTALIGVGWSKTSQHLMLLAFLAMPALTFAYCSHLFYCVSGSGDRRKNAALHEILLSVGFSIGSFGGGFLAQITGIRSVYYAAACLTLVAVALEIAFFLFQTKPAATTQVLMTNPSSESMI